MKREWITQYSDFLNREMHLLAYGHDGVPMIAVPCQDGMCDNWEGFQMPEELSGYIEAGKLQLFVVDTVDTESWSDKGGDKEHRAWIQEQYFHYLTEEALPLVRRINNTWYQPIVAGFSLGAVHATICFFRRPDLFRGVIACSGAYSAPRFWDGWCNGTLYDNSPVDFLRNMPVDHSYIALYNEKKIAICAGQAYWDRNCLAFTKELGEIFEQKGIRGWIDIWGYDSDHDWPWWKKQMHYHLPDFLD